jgi:hypothetical protein
MESVAMHLPIIFRHQGAMMLVAGRICGDFAISYGAEMNGKVRCLARSPIETKELKIFVLSK